MKLSAKKSMAAVVLTFMFADTAMAQNRNVQSPPPPPPPGIQAPNMNSTNQAISALRLRLDALRESVGRQVVVLHNPATDLNSWLDADNSFPKNNQRAEAMCKAGLETVMGAYCLGSPSRLATDDGISRISFVRRRPSREV